MQTAIKPHLRQVRGRTAPGGRLLTLHTLGLGLVSILAFLAVAVLAGQRGKPAPTTPAFLAKGPRHEHFRPACWKTGAGRSRPLRQRRPRRLP